MRVKANIEFFDKEENKLRKKGEEFQVTELRRDKLKLMGYAEDVPEEPKTEKKLKEAAN